MAEYDGANERFEIVTGPHSFCFWVFPPFVYLKIGASVHMHFKGESLHLVFAEMKSCLLQIRY
jgi:hypothetical protein